MFLLHPVLLSHLGFGGHHIHMNQETIEDLLGVRHKGGWHQKESFRWGHCEFSFFFLCYALHKDICPEKRALLFFSFLKMFLFYIVDLQSFISDVKQSNSVIYTYTYTYAFSDYFPILIIMEYWVEFLVLYSRSLLSVIYKY